MKFGKSFLLLLLVASLFALSGCTTRSPAVEVFEDFKAAIEDEEYSKAYGMLVDDADRPEQAAFEAGMKGDWAIWFGEDGSLRQVESIAGSKDHLGGDLVLFSDSNLKVPGGFEVFREDSDSEWKIKWKLGTIASPDDTKTDKISDSPSQ